MSNSRDVAEFVDLDTEVVAVDEVQFMDPGIVEVANDLADQGARVIVSGTDMDFPGASLRTDRARCWRSPRGSTSCTRSAWCAVTLPPGTSD